MGARGKCLLSVSALLAIAVFSVGCTADEPSTSIIAEQAEKAAESAGESDPLPEHTIETNDATEPVTYLDIEWTVEREGDWPAGLLDVSKGELAEPAPIAAIDLTFPETAVDDDGITWAMFRAIPTVPPDYTDPAAVVAYSETAGEWVITHWGTGYFRADALPDELVDSDFGIEILNR